ncbi:MAG TPA: thioester domain-containing protein [Solirubrobacteraceae bacterium]|nr:thioester domain-containing protein [Solirubrobacteraceae bacterium]
MAVGLALALGSLLLQIAPAQAVVRPGPPASHSAVRGNTEMTVTGWSPGQGVTGFIGNAAFDPVAEGYPSSNPTTDPRFTPKNEGFAGVIHGTPTGGGQTLDLYCIDINTDTTTGIGYALGTWDASNVMNVGYVARILNEYYPHTNEPAMLANGATATPDQTAAAVQAAIWFFSDRYVLSTSDVLHDTVVAIVNRIRAEGPLTEPPPPTLTITPATVSGARRVLGPFTVKTDAGTADVTVTGGTMYSNRAGTDEIGDGITGAVPSGQEIWLRSSGPSQAVLQAASQATVPTGNVYLYSGNNPGFSDAQRLILAETATLKTTVKAVAEFLPGGSLVVMKTIAGDGAGSQAQVVIHVDCDDGVTRPDFVIPAGTPAGTTSRTYRHIVAGTTCTVIETSNGSVVGTDVVVTGDGQQVVIPAGGRESVDITDTYTHVSSPPGSLLVTKTIAGPAAGEQGLVTIQVVCGGITLSPEFTIPADTPAGSPSQSYDDIPAGSMCTVTEMQDGATSTVAVTVSGNGQTVTVPAGEVATVNVMDVYTRTPEIAPDVPNGTLRVTKTIAGPAAGQQGSIAILVACGGPLRAYAYLIPAGTHAGSLSRVFPGLPAGTSCTVTETSDGHTDAVAVITTGRRKQATIPANGTATVHLTDTFTSTRLAPVTG